MWEKFVLAGATAGAAGFSVSEHRNSGAEVAMWTRNWNKTHRFVWDGSEQLRFKVLYTKALCNGARQTEFK